MTVLHPSGWVISTNNCPDVPLRPGTKCMLMAEPQGVYKDDLGGHLSTRCQ